MTKVRFNNCDAQTAIDYVWTQNNAFESREAVGEFLFRLMKSANNAECGYTSSGGFHLTFERCEDGLVDVEITMDPQFENFDDCVVLDI